MAGFPCSRLGGEKGAWPGRGGRRALARVYIGTLPASSVWVCTWHTRIFIAGLSVASEFAVPVPET